jgi:uncharacterized RDD family membrane protein YckC
MSTPRQIVFQTDDGIPFGLPLAGLAARLLACVIDFLVMVALLSGIGKAIDAGLSAGFSFASALGVVAAFAVFMFYPMALEWYWHGQTLGKRLLGLRVIDADGGRLRLEQVVLRNLLRAMDSLPLLYLVGGLSVIFSLRAQRLGDMVARTTVVRLGNASAPNLQSLESAGANSLLQHPLLAARLRQRLPPEAASVALQMILRRDAMEPQQRLALFAEVAGQLREVVPFPPAVVENLSDEQYVRAVVQALWARPASSAARR